jgi:hypothetical protein
MTLLTCGADKPDPAPAPKSTNAPPPVVKNVSTNSLPSGNLITFSARDISLQEALSIITKLTGTKVQVKDNVIMIVPKNAPDDEIKTKMYDVLPSIEPKAESLRR